MITHPLIVDLVNVSEPSEGLSQKLFVHEGYNFLLEEPTHYTRGLICVLTHKIEKRDVVLTFNKDGQNPHHAFRTLKEKISELGNNIIVTWMKK